MLIIPFYNTVPAKSEACFHELFQTGLVLDVNITPWPQKGTRTAANGERLPKVKAALAHSGDCLLLGFQVRTDGLLLQFDRDQDPVWQDSCVELFVSPGTEPVGYYNFELNARGACLSAFGRSRHDRIEMTPENLSLLERWSSAQTQANGFTPGTIDWQLLLRIPAISLAHHTISDFGNRELHCNLHACGDRLPHPYYLVWSPIETEEPDFHRPEYFRPLLCAASSVGKENRSKASSRL